ncbi:MAG: peptidoglycan-binding protein [Verrucomicrobia bacterium]|nr:peptidoglycan-binding protein [Verrucomicrobiota bacterium]MBV8330943.1 peptidoglycan-binding protein [Verrucomicrobiota bacterium]
MHTELFAMRPDLTCAHHIVTLGEAVPPISAAVGAGAAPRCANNPNDVKVIQTALNRFSPEFGGPQPNLDVDGKCGPLTRAAILRFQQKWGFAVQDGIVDVHGHTIRRLREGPPDSDPPPTLLVRNKARIIEVLGASQALLDLAEDYLAGRGLEAFTKTAFEKVDRQFHLKLTNDRVQRLRKIRATFGMMMAAIGHIPKGVVLAADEPPNVASRAYMFSYAGGMHLRASPLRYCGNGKRRLDTGSIYLCPKARTLASDAFAYVFIHELAHYAGPTKPKIDDVAYFKRNPAKFRWLGPDQAFWNADSYAQLAFAAVGRPDWAP